LDKQALLVLLPTTSQLFLRLCRNDIFISVHYFFSSAGGAVLLNFTISAEGSFNFPMQLMYNPAGYNLQSA
jgi:hypothetical protein